MSAMFCHFPLTPLASPSLMVAYILPVFSHSQFSHLVVRVETRLAYLVSMILELLTSVPRVTTFGAMLRGFTVGWFVAQ
jgi:hypothetical protein